MIMNSPSKRRSSPRLKNKAEKKESLHASENGSASSKSSSSPGGSPGRSRRSTTRKLLTEQPQEKSSRTKSAPNTSSNRGKNRAEMKKRAEIVLWKKPITTIQFFVLECGHLLKELAFRLWRNIIWVLLTLTVVGVAVGAYYTEGPHQRHVALFERKFLWCAYWVGLGILSSVGLGTGLHTFVLYLGPHIASVTLAAFECMSVDFPAPPYPDEIICPEVEGTAMNIWTIMSKVRLEAFMWGAGTALGELPPYFMARAASLSGAEDEELGDLFDESNKAKGVMARARLAVRRLVQRVGFLGILACASIPNPLFDLAGITCGHFLIPFSTFFGATLIGKAIIKMHIQKLFVILSFSEHHAEKIVDWIGLIPKVGPALRVPFEEYFNNQKAKLHHRPGTAVQPRTNWLSWVFEKVVILMILYFVLSIINSMAQSYSKRHSEQSKKKTGKSGKKQN